MRQEFIISLIPIILFGILKVRKCFHMLQQNWYDKSFRYFKWIFKNSRKTFLEVDLLAFAVLIICYFLKVQYVYYVVLITYLFLSFVYFKTSKVSQVKKPLVYTARLKRLTLTMFVLFALVLGFIYINFTDSRVYLYYFILSLFVYLSYLMVALANRINQPIEKLVYYHFYCQARAKLNAMNQMKKIGITGSYGKTTSKNVLNDILSVAFNVTPTPLNYNTAYGLINAINNYLDKFTEIFIAEMGTLKRGDIKKIANIVRPEYAILTKIGVAHLETLGSEANIQKEKFSLVEALPSDGLAVLNGDDEMQVNYELKNKCRLIWIGINNPDVDIRATNIKLTASGSSFDCFIKKTKEVYHFETRLLGDVNIYNILAGIALGLEFGIRGEKLVAAVKRVKPTEHRLELKRYYDLHIIDDAYNSNPVGSKMAVEVLGLMPGKKIVVTPGMIDLGAKQAELNSKFGEYIAEYADEVILVGKEQTVPIYEGLRKKKFDEKHIHVINDVKEAFPLAMKLKDKETYVLLENDLPDIFNEK